MSPRRDFLTACGALALAGQPVAATDFAADDPHIEWWREHEALEVDAEGFDDEDYNALGLEQYELLERIATTPASTIAGVLIQLRVVGLGIEGGAAEFDSDAMANALATLASLTGRA